MYIVDRFGEEITPVEYWTNCYGKRFGMFLRVKDGLTIIEPLKLVRIWFPNENGEYSHA